MLFGISGSGNTANASATETHLHKPLPQCSECVSFGKSYVTDRSFLIPTIITLSPLRDTVVGGIEDFVCHIIPGICKISKYH